MQTNILLSDGTTKAIDARVEKILKDLGNPRPPLDLGDVRQLLRLDLGWYSTEDQRWLTDKIHQLKVAGKQVLSHPSTILSVVKQLGLKGVLLVERRRILLDQDVPKAKHRWNEAHEITHDILPWHDGIAHGDPETTLSPACHELVEAEANYGAGRLLFLGRTLSEVVRSSSVEFSLVKTLHKDYGNTLTTTLWRVVEASPEPAFGIVGTHPRELTGSAPDDVKYFVRSRAFAEQFSDVAPDTLFYEICRHCRGSRGPLGDGDLAISNDRHEPRPFRFEVFHNGYDALTLGVAI